MEYSAETKLKIFLNHTFKDDVNGLMDNCFFTRADPEVSWQLFREQLRKLKKKHIKLYLENMESDDFENGEPSEWEKFKESRRGGIIN